jgi:hypothetical protein
MFDAWHRGTLPRPIVSAFRRAGVVPFQEDWEAYLRVDRNTPTRVRDWMEALHVEPDMGKKERDEIGSCPSSAVLLTRHFIQ